MTKRFLRGQPTKGERSEALRNGLHPFTVSELKSERQRLTSLKGRPATQAEAIEECYRDYGKYSQHSGS